MIPAVGDVVEVDGCVGSVAGAANVAELCEVVVLCVLHSAPKVIEHCCLLFLQRVMADANVLKAVVVVEGALHRGIMVDDELLEASGLAPSQAQFGAALAGEGCR